MLQYRGLPEPGSRSGWVGEQGDGGGDSGFPEGKPGKRITYIYEIFIHTYFT